MSKKEILKAFMPFLILFFIFLIPINGYSEDDSEIVPVLGETINVNQYKQINDGLCLLSSSHLYCIQRFSTSIGTVTRTYSVVRRIEITNGNNATVYWKYNGTEYSHTTGPYTYNAFMAYIFGRSRCIR